MRMFRFPSWISESRGGDEAPCGVKQEPIQAVTIQPSQPRALAAGDSLAKRKREEMAETAGSPEKRSLPLAKRKKEESRLPDVSKQTQAELPNVTPSDATMEKVGISQDTLRDAIDSQLGLEILLKHDELRLINQEIAKCQIALEQLRRCHLIPFPVVQGNLADMQNVSQGTGPALAHGDARPQWAAPYGVTDGPYTRHYAKWLIPDPSFDGIMPEWDRTGDRARAGKPVYESGRTTRHSFADTLTSINKMRTHRGASGQKLHALPSGYTQSKENAGPSVLKRSDGQMVKLVCLDCKRENFGSTQGFINHCRIAHRREFKSHEEAAVQSGVPIELDELGGIVGEEKPTTAATGLVHPLIRSVPTDRNVYATLLSRIHASLNQGREGKLPGSASTLTTSTPVPRSTYPPARSKHKSAGSTPFRPSSEAPFLSDLLKLRGFSGNLGALVGDAKKIEDMDDYTSQDEGSEIDKPAGATSRNPGGFDGAFDSPIPATRMPARATTSSAPSGRPGSSKGPDGRNVRKPGAQSGISPRLSQAATFPSNTANGKATIHQQMRVAGHRTPEEMDTDSDVVMLDGPSIVELSPNTLTSNNAPSLVSDDGEYDDGDDAESSLDGSEEGDNDSDVAEINLDDVDALDKVIPRTALRHQAAGGALRKEDRHVTFVSPARESPRKARGKK